MLVTDGGGCLVVLCANPGGALQVRDPKTGTLRKLRADDAVAELLLMAPEWRDLAGAYKMQNDTLVQLGVAREKQFQAACEERNRLKVVVNALEVDDLVPEALAAFKEYFTADRDSDDYNRIIARAETILRKLGAID